MCDFGIASDTARCAESFVKIGIIPGDGGAWLPPRIAGWPKAGEMALTGDAVSAEAALACGLFSQGVPADQLMAAAASLPSGSRSTRRARCG
jgi:enoyl-CoA hydratase/carnithine racemase